MGCDIHLYVERKEEGVWKLAPWDGATKPCHCTRQYDKEKKIEVPAKPDPEGCWSCGPRKSDDIEDADHPALLRPETSPGVRAVDWYEGRNYDLFSILADVRNGFGFAGCVTGEGFNPICSPRGVPEDASDPYKGVVERWDSDGHSHSWLTVAELLAYDWDQITTKQGVVSPAQYVIWREKGKPEEWCGGVSGPDVHMVSNADMESLIASGRVKQTTTNDEWPRGETFYTSVRWQESYRARCDLWWKETMPRLEALGHPDNVRIVFFFDN